MNIGYLKIELNLYFTYLKLVLNFQVNRLTLDIIPINKKLMPLSIHPLSKLIAQFNFLTSQLKLAKNSKENLWHPSKYFGWGHLCRLVWLKQTKNNFMDGLI